MYFVIIKDVFIFHFPVGALKRIFLLSSAQLGSDTANVSNQLYCLIGNFESDNMSTIVKIYFVSCFVCL